MLSLLTDDETIATSESIAIKWLRRILIFLPYVGIAGAACRRPTLLFGETVTRKRQRGPTRPLERSSGPTAAYDNYLDHTTSCCTVKMCLSPPPNPFLCRHYRCRCIILLGLKLYSKGEPRRNKRRVQILTSITIIASRGTIFYQIL